MLEVINLACARGDRNLFEGLNFALRPGELLHILGANGSGKTTLLRTLCGLTRPADGVIRWQGSTIRELGDDYRAELAYVGHTNALQGELTPAENLRAAAGLGAAASEHDIERALERFNLSALRSFPAKVLSQGQKRRLGLARLALLRRRLWIMDEPFAALDTHSIALVTELLAGHLAQGGLVALTSHQEFDIGNLEFLSIRLGP
ncbi:MAG: heme ABC transporter ATP-binding protein [Acidithiobacillales bacterium SM23_46]|nr:MAG: heme ABC transporter ATP-binding protein [Acidithiobacillales bacterium SM23_46]